MNSINLLTTCLLYYSIGLTDRSGMQFYFTHQRPTHLAGGISLGYPVTPDLVVPPGAANFTVQAVCSAACLEKVGLNLVSKSLYT